MEKKNEKDNNDKLLPRSVVQKAFLYHLFFRAGEGFTYGMSPRVASVMGIVLNHLYKGDKEKIGKELEKYYKYYNANINFDGLITGLVISMEEKGQRSRRQCRRKQLHPSRPDSWGRWEMWETLSCRQSCCRCFCP